MHAPVAGNDLPLVVTSHGDGRWFDGHAGLARAIAEAGMVVVALNLPGKSDEDETALRSRWIVERPHHLAKVDTTRVDAFGFSAGGHSVLAAAGAETSLDSIARQCATRPDEFFCSSYKATDLVNAGGPFAAPL